MGGCLSCLGMCVCGFFNFKKNHDYSVFECVHVAYVEHRWTSVLYEPIHPYFDMSSIPLQGPCRANILLGNQIKPIWGNCTLQTLQTLLFLLFLASGSHQGPQTAMMAVLGNFSYTAPSDSHASFKYFAGVKACVSRARWFFFCLCIFLIL